MASSLVPSFGDPWAGRSASPLSTRGAWIHAALLLAALLACASGDPQRKALLEQLTPQVQYHEPGQLAASDVIRYRAISRDDFLADAPPAAVAEHAALVGAYTCARIAAGGSAPVFFEFDAAAGAVVARSPDASFHAEMDRSCSWWNDEATTLPEEYVLQHEQIHLALVELFARRMDARVKRLSATGASPQEAVASFEKKVETALKEAAAQMQEQQIRFDRETSAIYRPREQERWYRKIQAELGDRAGALRPGGDLQLPAQDFSAPGTCG